MYAGDELYGDDITSGIFDDDPFDAVAQRAFCEAPDCAWSSGLCDNEDRAWDALEFHTEERHPGQGKVLGSIEES